MIPDQPGMSRCRCGVAFKYVGYGKRLCKQCMSNYLDRRAKTFALPKCRCGNALTRQRQEDGLKTCPRCEAVELQQRRQDALNRFADSLIDQE